MQFYLNRDKHQLKILIGSKSHHYNERRKIKAAKQENYIDIFLHNPIPTVLKQHHISNRVYSGGYRFLLSKHRNQLLYQSIKHNQFMSSSKNGYARYLNILQCQSLLYQCSHLQHLILRHLYLCRQWPQSIVRKLALSHINSHQQFIHRCVSQIKARMHLLFIYKPYHNAFILESLKDNMPFILDETSQDDGLTQDKIAGLYVNELDDILIDCLDKTLVNPAINTVDKFINHMFSNYDILVKTVNGHGQPLKFWHFVLLDYKKHCPDESARWLSEQYRLKPAYSSKRMIYSIHHNTVNNIHSAEQWLPLTEHNKRVIIFGDYGANQKKIQHVLWNKYRIHPVNHFDNQSHSESIIDMNLNHVLYYSQNSHVIPLKVIVYNQRNAFAWLRKHHVSYLKSKKLVRRNQLLHQYDKQIILRSLQACAGRTDTLENIFKR